MKWRPKSTQGRRNTRFNRSHMPFYSNFYSNYDPISCIVSEILAAARYWYCKRKFVVRYQHLHLTPTWGWSRRTFSAMLCVRKLQCGSQVVERLLTCLSVSTHCAIVSLTDARTGLLFAARSLHTMSLGKRSIVLRWFRREKPATKYSICGEGKQLPHANTLVWFAP